MPIFEVKKWLVTPVTVTVTAVDEDEAVEKTKDLFTGGVGVADESSSYWLNDADVATVFLAKEETAL
jgi:hypothetical protein